MKETGGRCTICLTETTQLSKVRIANERDDTNIVWPEICRECETRLVNAAKAAAIQAGPCFVCGKTGINLNPFFVSALEGPDYAGAVPGVHCLGPTCWDCRATAWHAINDALSEKYERSHPGQEFGPLASDSTARINVFDFISSAKVKH